MDSLHARVLGSLHTGVLDPPHPGVLHPLPRCPAPLCPSVLEHVHPDSLTWNDSQLVWVQSECPAVTFLIHAWPLSTKALLVPTGCLGSELLEAEVGDRWDQKGAQELRWGSLMLYTEDGSIPLYTAHSPQAQWVGEP